MTSRRSGIVAVVLALLTVVSGVVGVTRPVGAAPDPLTDPRPPGMYLEAWALSPSGIDPSEPGSRAFLGYSLDRGAAATDSVTVWNYSDVALTFHVYAADAFNNADGEFSLLPGDTESEGAGSWISLATNYVTVAPQTKADIPLTVRVPADASPGDHAAGIVASVPTPVAGPNGSTTVVDRRTGTRVYVRVGGAADPRLVVDALSARYRGTPNPLSGRLVVEYTVRNLGNTRLGAIQVVQATDPTGRTLDRRPGKRLEDVLPGAVVKQRVVLRNVPAALRVGAVVELRPVAPGSGTSDELPPSQSYTDHAWAIPWTLLLVLVLAVATWRFVRRRRRRTRRPAGRAAAPPTRASVPVP